jgi:choline dehydrogenase-like flavoprotein
MEHFDAIVLGMGPGSEVAADRLMAAGQKVAVSAPTGPAFPRRHCFARRRRAPVYDGPPASTESR